MSQDGPIFNSGLGGLRGHLSPPRWLRVAALLFGKPFTVFDPATGTIVRGRIFRGRVVILAMEPKGGPDGIPG